MFPPAIIGFTVSIIFLTSILQLSPREWTTFWITLAVGYGALLTTLYFLLRREATKVEEANASQNGVPQALSSCLLRTEIIGLAVWIGGGFVFGLIAAALIMPDWLGVQYFVEGAMITGAAGMAWTYWGAKRLLTRESLDGKDARYVGRYFSFGVKIGMVFIGLFIVSAGALVHLVSNHVSTSLERLALAQSAPQFERALQLADASPRLDAERLHAIRDIFPVDSFSLHRIAPDGTVTSIGEALEVPEVESIRRLRTGNSLGYRGPHVARFALLRDRSILVMSTPWAPYQHIPGQIAYFTAIIVLLTTLMFATATYFLSKDLVQPLNALMKLSAEMARGNFQHQVRIFSDDEVGQLADSFRETRNNLRGLLARVSGSGSTITDGVRVITGGTDTLIIRSREQNQLTVNSTTAVQNVRSGIGQILKTAETVTDLAQDASSGALELTASADGVARSMDHLFQSVEKTSSSVTEMDAAAREMSRRTTVLAGVSQEVLAFVTEMEATSEELRRTAQVTADLSSRVQQDAADGGRAVSETVEGISVSQEMTQRASNVLGDLQRSVNQISQILNVIEEVAEKTNLLSLNAAIIAAQAGEHGLGFTVVADEIRELAERTRGSTKEIAGIIKAIQVGSREAMDAMTEGVARVNENVTVAQNASASLEKIVASAARSGEMANNIARALQEQSNASRHLHQATSRMSDHISEIDKATAEQARGTQLLASESEKIRDIAGQVKGSTDEQSLAAQGITAAMEQIATDVKSMRDLLQNQLRDADQIAHAADAMLSFAKKNEEIAESFNRAVQNLAASGQNFESEVKRFRFDH